MPDDPTLRDVIEAFEIHKKAIDEIKAGLPSPELKEKFSKLEVTFGAFDDMKAQLTGADVEAKSQKDAIANLTADLEARDTKGKEIEEALETLQAEMARKAGANADKDPLAFKQADEYKALNDWARMGRAALPQEKAALLRTDQAISGGVLTMGEMETFLTREIIELNPMRELARVRIIGGESISLPIRETIPTATYEGQAEAGPDSQGTYKSETVTPFRLHVAVPATQQMLVDSQFDMVREIQTDAEMAFAVAEGEGFVSGSGFKEPAGFLNDARIGTLASTATAGDSIDGDDILKLQGQIKSGYEPTMVFNRLTLAQLRILRSGSGYGSDDGKGNYLWAPGLDGGAANTLGGMAYRIMPAMPNIEGLSKSVAIGDWARGYVIVQKSGVSLVRDDVTAADQAIVKFTWNMYNTGQVVIPEAIHILTSTA